MPSGPNAACPFCVLFSTSNQIGACNHSSRDARNHSSMPSCIPPFTGLPPATRNLVLVVVFVRGVRIIPSITTLAHSPGTLRRWPTPLSSPPLLRPWAPPLLNPSKLCLSSCTKRSPHGMKVSSMRGPSRGRHVATNADPLPCEHQPHGRPSATFLRLHGPRTLKRTRLGGLSGLPWRPPSPALGALALLERPQSLQETERSRRASTLFTTLPSTC